MKTAHRDHFFRQGHALAQARPGQQMENNRLAQEKQRRRFRIIQGGEMPGIFQVDRRNRVPAPHLERQLPLAGDAGRRFKIGHRPGLAGQLQALPGAQALEWGKRLLNGLHRCEHILTASLRQPSGMLICKKQIPLIPEALTVTQLNSPNQGKRHIAIAPFAPQLQRRSIFGQGRHLADILDRRILTQQGALAVFADSQNGGGRSKNDRRPTGRTGGVQRHDPTVNSVS